MSLVIAVKVNNHIYFGADTQTTSGNSRIFNVVPENYKVMLVNEDVIVGLSGSVNAIQQITFHKEWFDSLKEQKLSKQFIVESFLPKLFFNLKEYDQITTSDDGTMNLSLSILIGKQDKLYRVYQSGAVVEIPQFAAIGSGENYALTYYRTVGYFEETQLMLRNALVFASQHVNSVGGDITTIDTNHLNLERRQVE